MKVREPCTATEKKGLCGCIWGEESHRAKEKRGEIPAGQTSWGTYADGEFVAGQTVLYDENGKIQYRGGFQTVSMKEKAACTQTES